MNSMKGYLKFTINKIKQLIKSYVDFIVVVGQTRWVRRGNYIVG